MIFTSKLFGSTEVSSFHLPSDSDIMIITFAPLDYRGTGESFWGERFARRAGFAALGFVSERGNNWYPESDMRRAIDASRSALDKYNKKICYGSSMGGYAALKYSALIGANAVASFAPQFSIDPLDGVNATAYTKYFRPKLNNGMAIRPEDLGGLIYLFFDPKDRFDRENAERIGAMAIQPKLIPMPFAGHTCIKITSGTDNTAGILMNCLSENDTVLRQQIRNLRRISAARRSGIAAELVARRPILANNIIKDVAEKIEALDLARFYDKATVAFLRKKDILSAEKSALKAIALTPHRTTFMRRLGSIYEISRNYQAAAIWFEKAIATDPNDAGAYYGLAGVLQKQKNYSAAISATLQAISVDPHDPRFHNRLTQLRE